MPAKQPSRVTVTVEVHTPPSRPETGHTPRPDTLSRIDSASSSASHPRPPQVPGIPENAGIDAIIPAPPLTVSEIPYSSAASTPARRPLADFRVASVARLPAADAQGFRNLKGRLFVDMYDGSTLHVGPDPENGLFRAKLQSELKPSGPVLVQDPDSKLWYPLHDFESMALPLTAASLVMFRTQLDFTGMEPDSDGVYRFEGKRYAVIENQTYQVLHDLDASSPEHKVWRIVNPKDPVAADSENIYHASRAGETQAITRNAENVWVSGLHGLKGGMRRHAQAHDNKAFLLQRYEPIQNAFNALTVSDTRYGALWNKAQHLPEGSAAETTALVELEVHILKHTRMQAEYVKSLIDNKDWLILLKAGGLYKTELHAQQMNRVDYFNKLIAIMDRRVLPTVQMITVESCKKSLAHLNKKLKIMEDRQAVMDQIQKSDRSAGSALEELNREVPDVDQINYSKFNICLRLLSDDPNNPPEVGIRSYTAIHLFVKDMKNVSGHSQPIALQLALDEIRLEKGRFDELSTALDPAKAPYLKEALSLIDTFELKIDNRLNEIYDRVGSNSELPGHDQDIDFDFVPEQPIATAGPAAPRKMFRTRRHGTYRVLVGIKETAADGSVTVQVPDPFKPNDPPQRYEKRQGEWQPVRPAPPPTPKPQLISEATRLLVKVDEQLAQARTMEARKVNPTNIREFLDAETDRLNDLAKRLENTERVAEDAAATGLINRLKTAGDSLSDEGQNILIRMYKNRDVLDVLRLNFLLDHSQLNVVKKVERKQLGKGKDRSFLDVYSINDRSGNAPLWEAHFHYDSTDRQALDYTVKGAHMKTLAQSGLGSSFQRSEEQAGRAHQRIWREIISPKVAQKLFDHAQ